MAVTSELRRTSVTFSVAIPGYAADPLAPTPSELNNQDLVFNITCVSDEDGTVHNLADPETDNSYTYCDGSGKDNITRANPETTLVFRRDKDRTANGEFNTARDLFLHADQEYYIIKRVGPQDSAGKPYEAGDRVKIHNIKTDFPQDTDGLDEYSRITANTLSQGRYSWNYELVGS